MEVEVEKDLGKTEHTEGKAEHTEDSGDHFLTILNGMIKQAGGVSVFCNKHSLPIAVIGLVASGTRPLTEQVVEKICSVKELAPHLLGKNTSQVSLADRYFKNTDEKARLAVVESEKLLKAARVTQPKNPSNDGKGLSVEQLIERHRAKILREEANLEAAIAKAVAEDEQKKVINYSKDLAKELTERSKSGCFTIDDLIEIASLMNSLIAKKKK